MKSSPDLGIHVAMMHGFSYSEFVIVCRLYNLQRDLLQRADLRRSPTIVHSIPFHFI